MLVDFTELLDTTEGDVFTQITSSGVPVLVTDSKSEGSKSVSFLYTLRYSCLRE